jgi:hypothetical protein
MKLACYKCTRPVMHVNWIYLFLGHSLQRYLMLVGVRVSDLMLNFLDYRNPLLLVTLFCSGGF